MSFILTFKDISSTADISLVKDFMIEQSLGYPNYEAWVERASHEMDAGYKQAVMAFYNGKMVGDIVFQPHKEIDKILEIKNIRVHEEVRGRNVANFMLKQIEFNFKNKYDAFIVDAPKEKQDIKGLLLSTGYVPIVSVPLYSNQSVDIIYARQFSESNSGLLTSLTTSLLNKGV